MTNLHYKSFQAMASEQDWAFSQHYDWTGFLKDRLDLNWIPESIGRDILTILSKSDEKWWKYSTA